MKYIQNKDIFSKILEIPWSFSGDPQGSTEPWLGLNCDVRHVSMKQTCRGAPSVSMHLPSRPWKAHKICLPLRLSPTNQPPCRVLTFLPPHLHLIRHNQHSCR